MALQPGSKLGQYEIVSSLGAGGMGEVYRARDMQLGREVAIKLLLEEVSADPERLARFEREARVLAGLNHPNIASLFAFETSDSETSFLVMELVEGETLADLIARRPVPLEEAVAIFLQIAEGLDAAHQTGIVHRDLKPANIKVSTAEAVASTRSGTSSVKILDFGLAKAVVAAGGEEGDPSDSPTLTFATGLATQQGQILGTAAYMAPEQAKGRDVDRRADIWAFGACLFEALSGKRAFEADDAADTLAAVLRAEVEWERLPAKTPRPLIRLLRRCLERDPARRLRDIGDVAADLEEALEPEPEVSAAGDASSPRRSGRLAWALGALAAAVLAFGVGRFTAQPDSTGEQHARRPRHVSVPLPKGLHLAGWSSPTLAFSEDGRRLAFVALDGEVQRAYIRDLEAGETLEVPDSVSAEGPFFSPDGEWLGFATGVSGMIGGGPPLLKKYSLDTGLTQVLAEIGDYFGGAWGDGFIWYADAVSPGLVQLPSAGGEPSARVVSAIRDGEESTDGLRWPQVLANGNLLVTATTGGADRPSLLDPETRELRDLGVEAESARWIGEGHILFVASDGTTQLAALDLEGGTLASEPVSVMQDVAAGNGGFGVLAVSRRGSLAYVQGHVVGSGLEPMQVSRLLGDQVVGDLGLEALEIGPRPRLSPDGTRLAATGFDGRVRILDLERGTVRRLEGCTYAPYLTWSQDGRFVLCADFGWEGGGVAVQRLPASGEGAGEVLVRESNEIWPADVSPDGSTLLYVSAIEQREVAELSLDGSGDRRVVFVDEGVMPSVRYSPDGRWIAYVTQSSDRVHVMVRAVSGGAAVIASDGSAAPTSQRRFQSAAQVEWAPGGKSLYYRSGNRLVEVIVSGDATPELSLPRTLVELPPDVVGWQVGAEPGELIVTRRIPEVVHEEIQLVLNWFEGVRHLVEPGS
jgi:serine/threonine-protein kinase